jgi:peroxiredoxin Q/BCP
MKTEEKLEPGKAAPDFSLPASDGGEVSMSGLRGKTVVLYFYPKDDTPGCTKEACSFSESRADLEALGAVVLGVSKDPMSSHLRFKEKYGLTFPLLSDPE